MATDKEMKVMGIPTKCGKCSGFGYYAQPPGYTGIPVSMSHKAAVMGFKSVPCPECKASPNPNGRT